VVVSHAPAVYGGVKAAKNMSKCNSSMFEVLIKELKAIDRPAFEMAVLVVENPANRGKLVAKAQLLRERLKEIGNELKTNNPEAFNKRSDQISETLLDLKFVAGQTKGVSLRLNRIIQQKKRNMSAVR